MSKARLIDIMDRLQSLDLWRTDYYETVVGSPHPMVSFATPTCHCGKPPRFSQCTLMSLRAPMHRSRDEELQALT